MKLQYLKITVTLTRIILHHNTRVRTNSILFGAAGIKYILGNDSHTVQKCLLLQGWNML